MEKGKMIINGVEVGGSFGSASSVPYSNTNSGLEATNIQGAIDELNSNLNGVSFVLNEDGTIAGYTSGGADTVHPFKKESNKYLESASHGTQSKDAAVTATLNIDKQSIGDEGYLIVTGANKQSTNAVNTPTLTDLEIIETIVSENTGGGFPSMYYYKVKVTGNNPKVVASTISNDYRIIVYIIAHF